MSGRPGVAQEGRKARRSPFALSEKALSVADRLRDIHGETTAERTDPLDQLVMTILSQNTSDENRDRAWSSLRDRFPDWRTVVEAPEQDIEEAIRVGGLAGQKAAAIRGVLNRVLMERGEPSLDFLRVMRPDEVRGYLLSFKGVGRKTTAIVMLFSLGMPEFPVDTHVHRVARRLGLIGESVSRENAHDALARLFPAERYLEVHINMVRHGRTVCKARSPACGRCVLDEICDHRISPGRMGTRAPLSDLSR